MEKRPSYKYLTGISYRQRLEILQKQYLALTDPPYPRRRRVRAGAEVERVRREGRA